MAHACPGCRQQNVPPSLFACRACWRRLPKLHQHAVLRGFGCGRGSATHIDAMDAACRWFEDNPPARKSDGCTGTARYGSWDEAQLVLVDARISSSLKGSARRREQRSYYCRICDGWHLTSKPNRDDAAQSVADREVS